MKTLYRFIIIIGFVSCCINTNGQDITISSTDLVNLKKSIKQLSDSIAERNNMICIQVDVIKEKDNDYKKLKEVYDNLRKDFEREITQKDTIINSLKGENKKLQGYEARLTRMQEVSDKNIAKLANGRLYFKYSENLVQTSIKDLEELKTISVKKNFDQALKLLKSYRHYSADVKAMVNELQSIDRDECRSKHNSEAYKKHCIMILKSSAYYQNVYLKKSEGLWTIPYLDNIIDMAKSIISKHNPGEYIYANFTPLVEML